MHQSSHWLQKTLIQVCIITLIWFSASQRVYAQLGVNSIDFAGLEVCAPGIIDVPQILLEGPGGSPDELPTNIEADEIQTLEGEEVRLLGNAQVVQGRRGVFADEIQFNQETYMAQAKGNITYYSGDGDEIVAEEMEVAADTFIGTAENAFIRFADNNAPSSVIRKHYRFDEDYSMLAPFINKVTEIVSTSADDSSDSADSADAEPPNIKSRATAKKVEFEGKDYQLLHNATLTTCAEGDGSVLLTANRLELDHVTGIGTARNMTVRFKKIPVFYFPVATFPINNERKTGFLFPGFGDDGDSGTVISLPYYINLAPWHDATVMPVWLSKRGLQLYTEYRYLTQQSSGDLKGEFLPSDDLFGGDRHAISFNHRQQFGKQQKWRADIDLQDISDTEYLRDFTSDVNVSATTYIPQTANLDYSHDLFNFKARLSAYQRVNSDVSVSSQPYERLPQLTFTMKERSFRGVKYGADAEYTIFSHEDETDNSTRRARVEGSRLNLNTGASLNLEKVYGSLTPAVSVRSIAYSVDNHRDSAGMPLDGSPSISVPAFSLEGKLFLERFIEGSENTYMQTLEPRMFYLNIPSRTKQNSFPSFDTGGGSSSSFSHFFRGSRFFGGDRIGDAHQVSLGLTSRFINDESGEEKVSLSLGQIFYFDDRRVGLSATASSQTQRKSDLIGEASANITDDWSLRTFARYSHESKEVDSISLTANYNHSTRRSGSIAYSRTADSDGQVNFQMELPLSGHWQIEGRTDYSIEDGEIRSSQAGIFYDGCCWSAGLRATNFLRDGSLKNKVVFTFGLDDLGSVNSFF